MKILVRLPNWLGDMVMAVGFIDQLKQCYPGAQVSVIAKKGIDELLPFIPGIEQRFVFHKADHKGLRGAWRFGRMIRQKEKFDLFFSLPDSFSAGLMGLATGARKRVGFAKEMRGLFFTHTYKKPAGKHRVEEYISLLEQYSGQPASGIKVSLTNNFTRDDSIVVNINSEASSRRLTVTKAVELIKALYHESGREIMLVGAPKEKPFIDAVCALLPPDRIVNRAGDTNLPGLVRLLGSASMVLSTDSGPAHLSNALGVPTIVLFGAGNEANTAPYNAGNRTNIRLGKLSCEPCLKNKCVRYDIPQCLEQLNSYGIVATLTQQLNKNAAT
jgi:ADP-heptose:LPS heptosyltransferase